MPTALGTIASARVAPSGPIPMTGLALWLDPDDASTFTYGSLGNNVAQWRDKSGGNHHAAPKDGPTQPWPLRNVTINGRTALNFTPPGGTLEIAAFAAAYTAGEIFVVLDLVAKNDGAFMQNFGTGFGAHYPYGGSTVYESWGRTDRPSIGTPPVDLLTPHIYNLRAAAGSYIAAWNGTVGYSGSCTVGFVAATPYQLGAVGNPPNGYMGELVMYDRVLSTVERTQVEAYLTAKWIPPTYTDVLLEPFNNFTAWTQTGTPSIVAGRTGTAANIPAGTTSNVAYTLAAPAQSDYLTIGFAWRKMAAVAGGTIIPVVELRSDAGATVQNQITVLDTFVHFRRGTSGSLISGAIAAVVGTWYYIEVQVRLADSPNGSIIIRVDGVQVANLSGIDTRFSGATPYDAVRLRTTTGTASQFDDLYVTTGVGAPFKGSITIP